MQPFEFHHTVDQENTTAIAVLSAKLSLSVGQIKSAISKGALWHRKHNAPKNSVQRLRRMKKALAIGDELHFYYNADVLNQTTEEAILIEDCHNYSVWFKPYGMLAQGSKWSDHCTINRWVQSFFNNDRPCFIVHRLDKATSGLIIIAHSKKAAKAFGEIFEQHKLIKTYQAICHQQILSEQANNRDLEQRFTVTAPINDKRAISHFTLVEKNKKPPLAKYDITIETGRKHQIRQHCAGINLPIVGDRLHGIANSNSAEVSIGLDLQLCAKRLSFTCPFSEQVKDYNLAENLQLNWFDVINKLSS